jgi:hypothetical protein
MSERRTRAKLTRSGVVLGALLLAATVPADALAAPAAVPSPPREPRVTPRLPSGEAEALRREVARWRATEPAPFAAVAEIVGGAHARTARRAPLGIALAKLGREAALPILELLALDPPHEALVRRDLMEAVGLLRYAPALPVLAAILDDDAEDAETTRSAAEAIARIGTDEAEARLLASLASASGERERAIVAGMGECRRARIAEELARRLVSTTDEGIARAAARSLGRAGNAWAWRTMADRRDEARIREIAAHTLVDAFVRYDGEVRAAASNAMMVVDAPETTRIIEEARKGASPAQREALDALAERFARNPTRLE